MFGFSALTNIVNGALSWRDQSLGYDWRSTISDGGCLKTMVTYSFACLWQVFVGIITCLSVCLPERVKRPLRFSSRVANKWSYDKRSSVKIKLRQIPGLRPRGLFEKKKKKGTDRALANALVYDIVKLIAPKVHYVDLVNLSLVSKRVWAAMFPITEEKDHRQLRLYSCYGNRKFDCWTCGIQICNVSGIS